MNMITPTDQDDVDEINDGKTNNSCIINKLDGGDSDEELRQASLWKLLSLAKPEWLMLSIGVFAMVGSEATDLVIPKLLGNTYDALLDVNSTPEVRMRDVNRTMITVAILHFAATALSFVQNSISIIVGERVVSRLRCSLYRRIKRTKYTFLISIEVVN